MNNNATGGGSNSGAAGGGSGAGGNSSRAHLQSLFNNSLAIRQEIQRFESVHPSIYAIYHLIDLLDDNQVAAQIRDHVVCIEGWCVQSGFPRNWCL
ncbi:centaurin-gamma-1A-like [Armigeres subalbatus]|uniref:centaurin-gamma-1A-like n=1 Tax=Armigeres subalbatus TaxID=124917 RepID=UPI002ED1756D